MFPDDLRYTKSHEWLRVEGDTGIIGITDYAQEQLGDIVFIQLPSEGDKVTRGEEFGTIESVKAVSEVYAVVTGDVLAVNLRLEEEPELVNSEPYKGGWMVKVKLADPAELDDLMESDEYTGYIDSLSEK